MEVQVYYYSKSEAILSTQKIDFIGTPENSKNLTSYMTSRGANLYTESGIYFGKITSNSSWHIFNYESEDQSIRDASSSIKTDKGILYGMWSVDNPKNFTGDNILTIKPGYQSGYYFGKNIIFNIETLNNSDVVKITIFIN